MASLRPYYDPWAMSMTLMILFLIWGERPSLLIKSIFILADPATIYPCIYWIRDPNDLLAYSHATLTKLYLLSSLNLENLTDDWPPLLWFLMISLLTSFKVSLCPPLTFAINALFPSMIMNPKVSSFTKIYWWTWPKLKFLPHEYTSFVIGRCGSIT